VESINTEALLVKPMASLPRAGKRDYDLRTMAAILPVMAGHDPVYGKPHREIATASRNMDGA
jgi:hypothetical protein